jgi:ankyrin repeat protein
VSLLRERNASIDVLTQYPLQYKTMFGHQLQTAGSAAVAYNIPSPLLSEPISPLILAVYYGDFDIVVKLLEEGASIGFPDNNGRTPLMAAVDQVSLSVESEYTDSLAT